MCHFLGESTLANAPEDKEGILENQMNSDGTSKISSKNFQQERAATSSYKWRCLSFCKAAQLRLSPDSWAFLDV